jgi:hypothetical protein
MRRHVRRAIPSRLLIRPEERVRTAADLSPDENFPRAERGELYIPECTSLTHFSLPSRENELYFPSARAIITLSSITREMRRTIPIPISSMSMHFSVTALREYNISDLVTTNRFAPEMAGVESSPPAS